MMGEEIRRRERSEEHETQEAASGAANSNKQYLGCGKDDPSCPLFLVS